MGAALHRKVDRSQVYHEVARMISESPDKEVEISTSDLADQFGVQPPTMEYHLSKLVEEGKLIVSPKRGRYNRKIYRLPHDQKDSKDSTEILTPETTEKFKNFLQDYLDKVKKEKELEEKAKDKQEQIDVEQHDETEDTEEVLEEKTEQIEEKEEIQQEMPYKEELTLDEQIENFLNKANKVPNAEMLLSRDDREILSVMNETIRQNLVYLQDLSEQLSTIQNKQLIIGLIEERNKNLDTIKHLEDELENAKKIISKTKEKYEIDPNRVRFMQQVIVSTIDDYLNLPNHAIALKRKSFRDKVMKEISDLVKYVLGIEK